MHVVGFRFWYSYSALRLPVHYAHGASMPGNWPTNSRPVLEKVSHAYVIFFVLYITVIAFAVIRVISAVFLKDTLDAAQNDAEHMVVDRLRKKAEYVEKCLGHVGTDFVVAFTRASLVCLTREVLL